MDRNQAEEISRAADRFTEAVKEFSRSVERLAEHEKALEWLYGYWSQQGMISWDPEAESGLTRWDVHGPLGVHVEVEENPTQVGKGLPEDRARRLAFEAVRATRESSALGAEQEGRLPPPTPDEVKEWERSREERRRREEH